MYYISFIIVFKIVKLNRYYLKIGQSTNNLFKKKHFKIKQKILSWSKFKMKMDSKILYQYSHGNQNSSIVIYKFDLNLSHIKLYK
jgi:hypothetical protein